MNWEDKVALVTGASRGIGQGIASELARQGATVVGTATTEQGAESITQALSAFSDTGQGCVLDVRDTESVKALFTEMKATVGMPSILVNNAGITQDSIFLRMREEQWDAVIDANLNSLYRVTKLALKGMLRQRWGRIINIASVVAQMGNPGQANYCAAKAGMLGFTKSLALEMASYGITVNAVAPGFINTQMTQDLTEEQQAAVLSQVPMKSIGAVEDIAYAVRFLASDESKYMTGHTLNVNGGMCLA
ncbi:MAG: 3-oxoacyl-ACP reductase [Coxiellaceae bacterium]|nr:3-oxoacyl-ACP reductase [Coxiellaceae bacterium]|tara:strand:+ start:556 stop:1299 length:744 start_codon:yes stop_codon:yes gene_type:complete